MNYQYGREDIENAIERLCELYPKTFFLDPEQRRPLKKNVIADLEKDGTPLPHDLLTPAVNFYQSHFGYQYKLQTGIRRLDLLGKEGVPVTEQEQMRAIEYIKKRKREEREKRQQQERSVIVERPTASNLPNSATVGKDIPKETIMAVTPVKPSDPLASIQTLIDAVRKATFEQPEPLRRPFTVAGLCCIASPTSCSLGV